MAGKTTNYTACISCYGNICLRRSCIAGNFPYQQAVHPELCAQACTAVSILEASNYGAVSIDHIFFL